MSVSLSPSLFGRGQGERFFTATRLHSIARGKSGRVQRAPTPPRVRSPTIPRPSKTHRRRTRTTEAEIESASIRLRTTRKLCHASLPQRGSTPKRRVANTWPRLSETRSDNESRRNSTTWSSPFPSNPKNRRDDRTLERSSIPNSQP